MGYKAGSTVKAIVEDMEKQAKRVRRVKVESPRTKGVVVKAAAPVTDWFAVAVQGRERTVVEQGTQLKCLQYIADFIESNPDSNVEMYIASGLKVLGY